MKLIFSLLVCSILMSCGSTSKIERIDSEAVEVQVKDLVNSPEKYQGRLVKFNAYLIGSEFTQYEDAQIFVLCLADETLSGGIQDQIIFPDVKYKIRVAEDGYNEDVIKQCYTLTRKAGKLGLPIGVVGVFAPGYPYVFYHKGIDVYLQELHVDSRMFNTDFADVSKFAYEAPGTFKKVYKGGKKVFEFVKDLIP